MAKDALVEENRVLWEGSIGRHISELFRYVENTRTSFMGTFVPDFGLFLELNR